MKKLLACVVLLVACGDSSENNNDPICGDTVVEGTEQCDDGNLASGDGCSATCMREPRCGDSTVDGTEECDDGNTAGGDSCSATCTVECGNGAMDPGEECDDGGTTSFDGCSATCTTEAPFVISASWQIKTFNGATLACPTGFDTAAVISQPIDDSGNNVGSPIVDLFDCANGAGTTADLYEGTYKVHIAIANNNNTMTYATTPTTVIELTSNMSLATTIYSDAGYFAWTWQLIGAVSNGALTCAQAGATNGVEMVSTLTSSTTAFSDIYECEAGGGLTAALPVGNYTVSVSALDSNDLSIGTAPALTNKQVMGPNKITDLGTVTIPIDGK